MRSTSPPLLLPDHNIHAIDLTAPADGPDAAADRGDAAANPHGPDGHERSDIRTIVNNFHAPVDAWYGTFGIRYGRDD
jgi:hypothetical protein